MLPAMLGCLYFYFKPDLSLTYEVSDTNEKLSGKAKLTIAIFIATAACWIQSKQIAAFLGGIPKFDTVIALTSAVLLHACGLVQWKRLNTTEWSVLILLEGITLSNILAASGTSAFLASKGECVWFSTHFHFYSGIDFLCEYLNRVRK